MAAQTVPFFFEYLFATRSVPERRFAGGIQRCGCRKGLEIGDNHTGLLLREVERLHGRARHTLPDDYGNLVVARRAAEFPGHQRNARHLITSRSVAARAIRLE